VGHAIGANFVAFTPPEAVDAAWRTMRGLLHELMPVLYDKKDLDRQRVLAVDRLGMPEESPLLSISGVVVLGPRRGLTSPRDVARLARKALSGGAGKGGALLRA